MDGEITSNGQNGKKALKSGGGAGGSVLIQAAQLEGYGTISANGGMAYDNIVSGETTYGTIRS